MLVVDLDHTLIRTDLLVESGLSALALAPRSALGALAAAPVAGRAATKARLAGLARIDVAGLPYDDAVLARIAQARGAGERVALVSAADGRLVAAVAAHLGLFDEAHGSDGTLNLKGAAKAAFLVARYGAGGFAYIGDATADLAVWAAAGHAITVGAGPGLRRAVDGLRPGAEHLAPRDGPAFGPLLRAMRPHQWLKNTLVVLPVLAAHDLRPEVMVLAAVAFTAFSLCASGVYLLNDLFDLAADRAHPRKRRRPFASGAARVGHGLVAAPLLFVAALALALVAAPVGFAGVLAVYAAATFAYTLVLKRLLLIDIFTLAGLYTLRVIAGGVATGLTLSPWFLGFTAFLFLALAAMKRQTELEDLVRAGRTAAAGRAYRIEDLPIVTVMALAAGYLAVLVLALYVTTDGVTRLYARPAFLLGICPVLLYWVTRLVILAHRGQMDDDPLLFALRDPVSRICGLVILAVALAAI